MIAPFPRCTFAGLVSLSNTNLDFSRLSALKDRLNAEYGISPSLFLTEDAALLVPSQTGELLAPLKDSLVKGSIRLPPPASRSNFGGHLSPPGNLVEWNPGEA